MDQVWEDQISRNSQDVGFCETVGPAGSYTHQERDLPDELTFPFREHMSKDSFPLPSTDGREGYWGGNHLAYWLSGFRDSVRLLETYASAAQERQTNPRCLDFGGASARVARHLYLQHNLEEVYLTDINRRHINFVAETFNGGIKAFQHTHIPILPIEDNYFDIVCAYSVFTHIETFDDGWLLELRRILKQGGLLYLTANIDNLQVLDESWPAYIGLRNHPHYIDYLKKSKPSYDRLVFRWSKNSPYSSLVFLSEGYVMKRWAPFFSRLSIGNHSPHQNSVTLIK